MPACDENDPVPCKTKAELDAEETPREKLDDVNDEYGWVRIAAIVIGLAVIAGGVIRACWS